MSAIITPKGEVHQIPLDASIYSEAHAAGLGLPAYLNRKYGGQVDASKGSVFQQMCASEGIYLPTKNDLQLRAASIGDILAGKAALQFDAAIVQQRGGDFGTQSRILFPAAVVDMIEVVLKKDLTTDTNIFNTMVALDMGVASDTFEQPVIDYRTANGPDGTNRAQAQRIAQLATPPVMATFTTAQNPYRLPTFAIGAEFSQQAMRATTLDLVALALARFLQVEKDGRVYDYLSTLWGGNPDLGASTAISGVTTVSLDSTAAAGTVTHKAWLKWLYRNRKTRRISHIVCDIDTYLKIEGRSGRPGIIAARDPQLPTIDPQAAALNPYVDSVKVFLVDAAASGGPVPANTVWGVDARYGIVRVSNTAAQYQAAETFALKRSEAFRIDWSEAVYRQYDEAFDVLTIS